MHGPGAAPRNSRYVIRITVRRPLRLIEDPHGKERWLDFPCLVLRDLGRYSSMSAGSVWRGAVKKKWHCVPSDVKGSQALGLLRGACCTRASPGP